MSARRFAAAVSSLAALASACSYSVVRDGRLEAGQADRIRQGVAAIRGLDFLEAVPMEVKKPDELRAYLLEEMNREYTPQEIAGIASVYSRLGLLPREVDLTEALLRLYGSQVAGFYDPRARKLFLVHPAETSGGWLLKLLEVVLRRDLVGEMLLAHELTHALQDQHFGIVGRLDDAEDEDRAVAAGAVVEGDATLAGFAYVFGGLPDSSLFALVERLQGIPVEIASALPETPAVLRDALIFRYTQGARFVAWAYLHGGWSAVDALLASPPTSSEQVLWPEKYYVTRDDPTAISLGGLEDYRESREWTMLEENTLGELMIRILMREFFPDDRAEWIARGWDGDRFGAWRNDSATHLFWTSVWDSDRDAIDFFRAEGEILARLFPQSAPERTAERIETRGEEPWLVERRDRKVLVIVGVPAEEREERIARIWSETTFTPASPALELDRAESVRPEGSGRLDG
ncbi:MAG: hypothetical protein ACREQ9_10740 [Candidatus Binatia bacterium]